MGMSSAVYGITSPDEKWNQMKSVYDSCVKADVEIPDEVSEFFGWEPPDDDGVIKQLASNYSNNDVKGVKRYIDDMEDGFEVDLRLLPEDIHVIRFVNSY